MPIYEYRCAACGHALETIQKISDAPLRDCPACQKPELQKQISAPAFRLNGSGWYETDFKTGKKKNLTESAGTGDSKTADTAPATTDSSSTNNTASSTSSAA